MEKLKQKLAESGLAWKPAFDHSDFISVLDGEADTICRIYKHDGKYYLRYFGNYVYGCSDYSFDRVFDLIDHIFIQMDAMEEPTKKMQNFISKLRTLVGSPDLKIIWLNYAKPQIRIDYSDGASICTVNLTDDHKINISYYYPFWNPNYGGFKQNMVYNHLRIAAEGIMNRVMYYFKEVNNMKKRFIVEKMDVENSFIGPDAIHMTIRQEPDGIPRQTGKELKELIESLDPNKLSDDIVAKRSEFFTEDLQRAISSPYKGGWTYSGKSVRDMYPNMKINITVDSFIKDVIFNDPATIVFWVDGSKTVVKCQKGETFDPEKGLAIAISKKVLGNDYRYYETFAKHVGRYNKRSKKKYIKAIDEVLREIAPDEIVRDGVRLSDRFCPNCGKAVRNDRDISTIKIKEDK